MLVTRKVEGWHLLAQATGRTVPFARVLNNIAVATSISLNKGISMKKIWLVCGITVIALLGLTACQRDADIASYNLSKAADMFEVTRRVVFYNGISGDYILTIEGRCSLGNKDISRRMSVTCKTGENSYKKHYLGLSDNVTFFAEQLNAKDVSVYHHRVIFKPQTIIPEIDVRVDGGELLRNRN